jgi:hypothetical protein
MEELSEKTRVMLRSGWTPREVVNANEKRKEERFGAWT